MAIDDEDLMTPVLVNFGHDAFHALDFIESRDEQCDFMGNFSGLGC